MRSGSWALASRGVVLRLVLAGAVGLAVVGGIGAADAVAGAQMNPSPGAAGTPGASSTAWTGVSPPAVEPAIPEAPDSPRASMREFLRLSREGRYEEATRYLDVPSRANGPELAQRLRAVLERHVWIEPAELSPLSLGDPKDGAGVEEVGTIATATKKEPVRLVRKVEGGAARWVFSRATVERVDAWYSHLEDRWLRDLLPEALLRPGPRELLWWQWLALPVIALVGWVVGRVVSFVARLTLGGVVARTKTGLDDELLDRSQGPITFAVALGVVAVGTPWLGLYGPAEVFLTRVLSAAFFVAIFWAALRVIDASAEYLLQGGQARDNASARSLAPLAGRIAKVMVFIIGVIAVLSELGYPVASLIAGLGIGGVALALAAQKTVENLFGSISIGLDRPFRVGDFVKIEEAVMGTVEAIGLRSTRLRTLDRTVVTMPNGKLADMRVESYTARDRFRLACIVSLVYATTAEQLKGALAGMEEVLRKHPQIWPDDVVVRFQGFGAVGMEIEVMAWFQVETMGEFREARQQVLLGFMEAVEAAGTRFALPAQRLHLVGEGGELGGALLAGGPAANAAQRGASPGEASEPAGEAPRNA
ncbi:mechanosensitive ion channel family protein [Chondromyces apiculatus]|nr:mechanosensitive ion channel family protein [Chondromyces apiculatus]